MDNSSKNPEPRVRDTKPTWLKVRAPGGESYAKIKQTLRGLELHTVCEEAHCPNVGECWSKGTATVMVLGDTCSRSCRFCAVKSGKLKGDVDSSEPEHVANAVARLGLRYVVLTMVDRDDLLDGGAAHVRETVQALGRVAPDVLVEVLVGDFGGQFDCVDTVLSGSPAVFGHNIEVVRRLTRLVRDQRCNYDRSLQVLRHARERSRAGGRTRYVKSSLMVGLGETDDEVEETLIDLRGAGVDIVTLGQYLRPSARHLAVERYVSPDLFEQWRQLGQRMGFAFVASGPLVRSSYHAAEVFVSAGDEAASGRQSAVGNEGLVEANQLVPKNRVTNRKD